MRSNFLLSQVFENITSLLDALIRLLLSKMVFKTNLKYICESFHKSCSNPIKPGAYCQDCEESICGDCEVEHKHMYHCPDNRSCSYCNIFASVRQMMVHPGHTVNSEMYVCRRCIGKRFKSVVFKPIGDEDIIAKSSEKVLHIYYINEFYDLYKIFSGS